MTAAPGAGPAWGSAWADVLAAALVGTARGGGRAEALLDVVAAQALRRRAGVALVPGVVAPAPVSAVAPVDGGLAVSGDAAARADVLLAFDSSARDALPVKEMAARLELLAEWLEAAAAADRRMPPELVPALLDVGRRHRVVRPWIARVAGPVAAWLAGQRAEWSYAASAEPAGDAAGDAAARATVDGAEIWDLGTLEQRVAHLARLRHRDPAAGRELLEAAWEQEPPDARAALLEAIAVGLGPDDEALLERALDDRRRQVRDAAVGLLRRLPAQGGTTGTAYGRRMAARARRCLDLGGDGPIGVEPPHECDRWMRRDGVVPKPPTGTGERAWWLEEILAYTPLRTWPDPAAFLARGVADDWWPTVRRGLVRAAAAQRDSGWAGALVGPLTEAVPQALYAALPPEELAERATATLRQPHGATAVGVEHVLALVPRPWPAALAEAVFGALDEHLAVPGTGWRVAALCELGGLRLPADLVPRATALIDALRQVRPNEPSLRVVDRFAATLRFRHQMLEELRT